MSSKCIDVNVIFDQINAALVEHKRTFEQQCSVYKRGDVQVKKIVCKEGVINYDLTSTQQVFFPLSFFLYLACLYM